MKKIGTKLIFTFLRLIGDCNFKFIPLAKKNILFCTLVLVMYIPTFPLHAQTPLNEEAEEQTVEDYTVETSNDNRLNYIGIGGAIGLEGDGDTALGDGGFSILGRVAFTNNLSIHSSAIFNDNDLFSVAGTYGVPIKTFFPFVGAGLSADTDDFDISPEIVAGVDLPIKSLFTGTARVNANFNDETDIGLLLGAGINF